MTDIVLGIRLTADGKGVVTEVRGTAEEIKRLGEAAGKANTQAASEGEKFTASLRRQADTLGMTKSQTLAYEASQHQLTAAQKESAAQSMRAIDAHEKHQATLARVTTIARGAALAITAMAIGAVKASVTEAAAAEQAHLKLEAVLRATGHAAGLAKLQLDAMAESLKRRTGFDDDQVRNSMAVMLTFKQVQGETFGQAMKMATDLSKLLGQDLQSSVLMLGKALEDPETGLTALRRAGVSFNDSQKETIKYLVATGDQAEALTLILQIMKSQGIDGIAEAMHKGLKGAAVDSSRAWSDLLKAIGQTTVVKASVEGTLGSWTQYLTDMKNVIESGDWLDRLAFFSAGFSTPKVIGMREPATDPTAQFTMSERAAVLGSQDRARIGAVREQANEYLKQFRSDNQKLEDELKKWRALSSNAQLGPDEAAAGEASIRAKFYKKDTQAEARAQFIKSLEREAATLGLSTEQARLYEAQQLKLSPAQMAVAESALAKTAAYRAEQEALKGNVAAIEQRMGAEAAASAALASFVIAQSEVIQQTQFETQIMGLSEREREKAIALRKLEADWIKTSVQLKGDELDTAKKIYDQQKRDLPGAIDARATAREAVEARKKEAEEWKDLWSTVERTGKDVFVQLTSHGRNAFEAIGKSIKAAIIDMLYQLTVRKWIINIGASISGSMGASAANAAGGLGGAGGISNLLGMGGSLLGGGQAFADIGNFARSIGTISESGEVFGLMDALGGFAAANPVTAALAVAGLALGAKSLFGSKKTSAFGTGYSVSGAAGLDLPFAGSYLALSNKGPEPLGGQASWAANFNTQVAPSLEFFRMAAAALGLDTAALRGRAFSISGSADMSGRPEGANAAAIADLIGQMALELMPNLKDLAQQGETLAQTFARIGVQAQQANLQQISSLMGAAIGLQDATRDLWLSDLSPLTAAQRLAEARGRYTETLGLAQGGDARALGDLAGISRTYLEESRGYYAGASPQYTAIFRDVQDQVTGLVTDTLTEQSIRFAEMGLTLKDIAANTKDLDSRIAAALQSAIDAWQAAQLAALAAAGNQITAAVVSIPPAVTGNVTSENSAAYIDDGERNVSPIPVYRGGD